MADPEELKVPDHRDPRAFHHLFNLLKWIKDIADAFVRCEYPVLDVTRVVGDRPEVTVTVYSDDRKILRDGTPNRHYRFFGDGTVKRTTGGQLADNRFEQSYPTWIAGMRDLLPLFRLAIGCRIESLKHLDERMSQVEEKLLRDIVQQNPIASG